MKITSQRAGKKTVVCLDLELDRRLRSGRGGARFELAGGCPHSRGGGRHSDLRGRCSRAQPDLLHARVVSGGAKTRLPVSAAGPAHARPQGKNLHLPAARKPIRGHLRAARTRRPDFLCHGQDQPVRLLLPAARHQTRPDRHARRLDFRAASNGAPSTTIATRLSCRSTTRWPKTPTAARRSGLARPSGVSACGG